ncbi:MAG: hypothetical protein AMJ84_11735 [Acidithiobacillales bacterium SM23_46]|jgi:hypothetical protein|nr:MAG: hypothetical protein AMJ84_11735 [Acidithiobacillales bacterium SM23_46]
MEQVSVALEPVRAFMVEVGQFFPKLLVAAIILVAGWMVAKLVRVGLAKGLKLVNFNVLAERAGMDDFLKQGDIKTDTVGILALLAYWLVILLALMMAFNSLGLTYVTDLVGRVVLFVPKVIVAVVILAIGAYFARFVARVVSTYAKNVGIEDADLLGRISMYAIMVFVVLIALDQVNIGGDIIRQTFLIVLAGGVLALAIAFGIGGQKWAGQILDRWWPKKGG